MTTILIVEDQEQILMLAKSFLEEQGHKTLSAATADEALAILTGSETVDALFAKLEAARASAIEEGKSETAALRDRRYLASAKRSLRRERPGALVRGRTEIRTKRSCYVGKAFGIRSAHCHVVAPRCSYDLMLQALAGFADLGKAGAQNDRRAHASAAAAIEFRWHVLGGNDQEREIGHLRQRLD